jgi:LysM repeat protein
MVLMAVKLVRSIHGDYMVATGKLEARQTSPSAVGEPLPVRARTLTESTPAAEPAESPVANKTVSPVPTRESQVAVGGTGDEVIHVVRSGDTLSTLAKSYNTSVRAIKWANGLGSERLTVGTRLRMPASGPSSATAL